MSNQPKITYRSDTSGINYMMNMEDGGFVVAWEYRSGEGGGISPFYAYKFPWRLTVNYFFDIIDKHINDGVWGP